MAKRQSSNTAVKTAQSEPGNANNSPVVEQATGEQHHSVVVLAYEGTEDRMRALWEKNYKGTFEIRTVEPGYKLLYILAEILADRSIEDEFILVQANTFPVCSTPEEILRIPVVYINAKQETVYNHRLPMRLNKAKLTELLGEIHEESAFEPERFLKKAVEDNGRPIQVSHHFGNYFLQVVSADPCRHKAIEGFVLRRFIGATPTGWNGILSVIDEYLKK